MADNVTALKLARVYYDKTRRGERYDKVEAVVALGSFSLFTPTELASILDCSVGFVRRNMGMRTNMPWSQRVWDISVIDGLELIAEKYRKNIDCSGLVKAIIGARCSIKAMAELTGVPKDKIREILYESNSMGILRSATDSESA